MKYIYFGTPEFAKITLDTLIEQGFKPALVVTVPDKPIGRKQELTPPPVKILAEQHEIPVLQPEKFDEHVKNELEKINPDLFIVSAYGKILPRDILDIPKHGSLNVHPSLLPKYRGPSPVHYAILEGDSVTGTTIMVMDEKMDHGSIIAQEKMKISENDTTETLSRKLAEQGAHILTEVVEPHISGKIEPQEQEHASASYTHIIKREDGHINWQSSARFIERQLRAFTPWPGVFTYWDDKRLKILSLGVVENTNTNDIKSGEVINYEGSFAVKAERYLVLPKEVQMEGKKKQSADEFLHGHPEIIGSVLK